MAKKKKPAKKVVPKAPAKKKAAAPKKAAKPAKKAVAPKAKAIKPAKAAKPAKVAKPVVAKKGPAPEPEKKSAKVAVKPEGKKAATKVTAAELQPADVEAPEEEQVVEVVLTDAEGRRYCRTRDCDQLSIVDGYCRYHYLLFWKKIQVRKKILTEGKLERYIEELTSRYPDKYLDMLKKDLRSEKDFLAAIAELEIDESAVDAEFEDEAQNYIDEVRGMGEGTVTRDDEDF